MDIKSAEFVSSFVALDKLPKPDMPEYAFIGRSNVGKSSLINMLTNRKSLAKTSVTPGKTQTINHFIINKNWYLVDLPGYGYAKTSKSMRKKWEGFISEYLLKRENLQCTFVLLDSRLEPQKIDIEFMEWLAIKKIPFAMVFTKMDKLKKSEMVTHIERYKRFMLESWEELPMIFLTSSANKMGKEPLLEFIDAVIHNEN
jgi:GTP-binding protein